MTQPLVSCICPTTTKRLSWMQQLIECFEWQTYFPRELVVVADYHLPVGFSSVQGRIKWIFDPALLIGTKRNLACQAATGEIICHFDDDDVSGPERVSDQVQRILDSGKSVTGYSSMMVKELREVKILTEDGWRPTSGWWRMNSGNELFGSSLCYYRSWWEQHRFPQVMLGEDHGFWSEAGRLDQAVSAPAGEMMYATNHRGNVSNRMVGGINWEELPGGPSWLTKSS